MKILIITQVLDTNHPILGFFHRWVAEFAAQVDEVHVIALQVGAYSLPANVTVHSLGKESGKSRLTYLRRFYSLIWRLRSNYGSVFVHMNQQYVMLGYPLWHVLTKRIGLWYAHGAVSRSLKLAVRLTDSVITSTPQGLQIDTPKRVIVGQGIDMNLFSYHERRGNAVPQLMTDGRITRSKNLHVLLQACALLRDINQAFIFHIVGAPLTVDEEKYANELRTLVEKLKLEEHIVWHGGVSQATLTPLLHASDVYIHDGSTQSLDKSLVQAVATGLPTVSSNAAFAVIVEPLAPTLLFPSHNAEVLAEKIKAILDLSPTDKIALMEPLTRSFRSSYSIEQLVSAIILVLKIT